jgi:hypothetical protein
VSHQHRIPPPPPPNPPPPPPPPTPRPLTQVIATTVSSWLQDDDELARLSAAALSAGQPEATRLIAKDLVKLLKAEA